jgi:hypothetical protein
MSRVQRRYAVIGAIIAAALSSTVHAMHVTKVRYAAKKLHQKTKVRIPKSSMNGCHMGCAYKLLKPDITATQLDAGLERCCQGSEVAERILLDLVRAGSAEKLNVALQYYTPEPIELRTLAYWAQFSHMQSKDDKHKEVINLLHSHMLNAQRHEQTKQLVLQFLTRDRNE